MRDALHVLANEVDAPVGSTVVVNPSARERRDVVEGIVPGSGPCHFVGPDGTARATQVIGELRGEGYNTMVTGQKVRWVLDLMRGTEFAGRQITSYEIVETPEFHDVVLQEAGPGETRRDLTELKTEMLALGDAGRSMRFRLLITPHRHVLFDSGPVAGFGWAAFTVAEGDASEALVHSADEASISNEHLRVNVDRRDGTYAIETSDGIAARRSRAARRRRRRRRHVQLLTARDRPHRRHARSRPRQCGRNRTGAGPAPHRGRLHLARVRGGRRRVVLGTLGTRPKR